MKTDSLIDSIKKELLESRDLLSRVLEDSLILKNTELAAKKITDSLSGGGKILTCGNGGSMSDAMHFAEELTGRYRDNRNGLPAIAISDPAYLTCTANDFGFNEVFSRYIDTVGNRGDILVLMTTSGNSKNIINAAKTAGDKEIFVVGLTGNDGGEVKNHLDLEIRVPHNGYADRIQEIHIKILHILIYLIEKIKS